MQAGEIVLREQTVPDGQTCLAGEWIEEGDAIGSHTPGGLGAMTFEDLYAFCYDHVLCTLEGVTHTFTVDDAGILQQCRYTLDDCSDGCDSSDVGTGFAVASYAFAM